MKQLFTNKNMLLIAAFALAMGTGMTSCKKKEGCTDPAATNYDPDAKKDDGSCNYPSNDDNDDKSDYETTEINGETYNILEGTVSESTTLGSDQNWLISGGLFVDEGVTLTIEKCTEIYAADDGTVPFLSIKRGGKIMAEGTSSCPIVFSTIKKITGTPGPGDWGGIIVNGYARINNGSTAEGEGGTGTYGGSDDADNSGIIRYVRVEYAGKILGTDNELNGFSFNAVGSGTTVEYIQAYKGADDGIEFFGGNVNVKYAVSSGNDDDSFDWTYGWRGNGQFWVVEQSTSGGDRGFECDNNGDNNIASPYSNPSVANITIVMADDGDGENTGMRLREGTKAKIRNAIIVNAPKYGVRVSDSVTTVNMNNNDLSVKSSILYNAATSWKDCSVFANDASNDDTTNPNLNGYVGTVTNGNESDPTTLGSFFSSGSYIGAVPSGNDWTSGWTAGL